MTNHVAWFIPHLSDVTEPICSLLNKNSTWTSGPSQEKAFSRLKLLLSSDTCMAKYDPCYHTVVSADASSYGLGAVLLQDQPEGTRRAVAYASRALTPTEARYSQTEKESLAVTWAISRYDQFLCGLSFEVETDHLPLVTLLGNKDLELVPPRIQRMRIKLMRYQYVVKYVPGKHLATADTLSRAPSDLPATRMVGTLELFVGEVFKELPPLVARRLEDVRIHQAQDGVCSAVMTYCMKGWPDKNKVPLQITPFWKERDRLSIYDGILLLDRRLVIPSALRQDILALLHEGHQGVRRCQERARESVWWPNCNMHVEHMVTQCAICAETRVQRSEPLLPTVTPDRPWQHLGIDLFQLKGRDYVLIVDYYSRFPEVVSVGSTTAPAVISAIKSCIARFGIPDIVRTDNGPQFVSNEFAEFARSYGFRHETSSPRYPQSNGEAERMVRTMKDLLFKGPDPYLALLSYRDTPGPNGISPAQALMGRKLQTRLPKLPEQLVPSLPCHTSFREKDSWNKARQAMNYNRRHASSQLAPLSPGDYVWVTDTRCSGEVLSQAQRPRSYLVQTPRGVLQRNRRHLVLHSSEATPAQLAASPPVTPEIMQPAAPREDPTQTEVTPQETLTQTRSGRIVRPPRRLDL